MPETLSLSELNVAAVLPELVMILFVLGVMAVDMFSPSDPASTGRRAIPWVALAGVVVTLLVVVRQWDQGDVTFQAAAVSDQFALGLRVIVLVATGMAILMSINYIDRLNKQTGEYYALILLSSVGMMAMGMATDLITVFLALEIFSLALYILTGIFRESERSSEASMKYFLLGAFASAFFVYGAALIYGAAGSTQYADIAAMISSGQADTNLLYPGIALLVVGFGFKVSLVPFHMWTPDVYQGAPTPVTAFMSAGTKAAAFAALARVLVVALPDAQPVWGWALALLAVVTMLLGNLTALQQTSLKRMLAYSSIAHAGYILVGLTSGTAEGASAALFYLFSYSFMNMGALAVIISLEQVGECDALNKRAAGLAQRQPLLAFIMAVFMFGLSGMPPLAGFFGKLLVFQAAVAGGWAWLAAVAMLTSVIGAYYYLRVVIAMYFGEATEETASAPAPLGSLTLTTGMAIAAVFTVLIGITPGIWSGIFHTGLGLF
jgi:NADH-quinone oxidoreductase subunit N